MAGKKIKSWEVSNEIPKPGMVKEYYRYPALEAYHKGRVRIYFADTLYKMVNDPSTDSIVSWSQDGKSFIFWDQDKFITDVLPKYGLCPSPTFIFRMQNLYRFRKVEESEHSEYAHDYFMRGKPELTVEIERQFQEWCAPSKNIEPPEPGSKAVRERKYALFLAEKAARKLSIS